MNKRPIHIEEEAGKSTCQKRVTIVELYSEEGKLLTVGSNRCNPEGGTCHRLGLVQNKGNYDRESHCNWTHAEIMAINGLPVGGKPYRSVLWGHDFYCDACENALREAGVQVLEVKKT